MAELKDRLRADLTASMKERNDIRTRTLRMVLTEISKEEVSGAASRELDDAEIQRLLVREAKRRREAADAFRDAGRADQCQYRVMLHRGFPAWSGPHGGLGGCCGV